MGEKVIIEFNIVESRNKYIRYIYLSPKIFLVLYCITIFFLRQLDYRLPKPYLVLIFFIIMIILFLNEQFFLPFLTKEIGKIQYYHDKIYLLLVNGHEKTINLNEISKLEIFYTNYRQWKTTPYSYGRHTGTDNWVSVVSKDKETFYRFLSKKEGDKRALRHIFNIMKKQDVNVVLTIEGKKFK